MTEHLFYFLLGAFGASIVCWLLWDDFQFRWTLKHGLRYDLFTMSRAEVREELRRAVSSDGVALPAQPQQKTTGETE